jgi:hypothetical protein
VVPSYGIPIISTIATDKGHDVSAYLEALRRVQIFASKYLVCGTDSVVFDRGNEVVKVTEREFREEYGTRPFDIPIIERRKMRVREGKVVTVYVQPRAIMDCNERDTTFFRVDIEKIGYSFTDYGMTQIGRYKGNVVLVDPFAVR